MEQKICQEIVEKYNAGVKTRVIEREYCISHGQLYRILDAMGTKPARTRPVMGFGTCLFQEYPAKGCSFCIDQRPARACIADDWDIVECYMHHYQSQA